MKRDHDLEVSIRKEKPTSTFFRVLMLICTDIAEIHEKLGFALARLNV